MLTNADIGKIGEIGENLGHKAEEAIDEISAATGFSPAVCAAAIVILVLIAILIFTKPIRIVLKLAVNTLVGVAALLLINTLGARFGINIDVTWQNAVITALLGAPGVAVLLILKWIGK